MDSFHAYRFYAGQAHLYVLLYGLLTSLQGTEHTRIFVLTCRTVFEMAMTSLGWPSEVIWVNDRDRYDPASAVSGHIDEALRGGFAKVMVIWDAALVARLGGVDVLRRFEKRIEAFRESPVSWRCLYPIEDCELASSGIQLHQETLCASVS